MALRESEEEVGIRFSPGDGAFLFTKVRGTIGGKRYNDIVDVWLFRYDGPVHLEQASTDEVAQAKWMSREEILRLYQENKLVHSIKDLSYFFQEMATS